MSTCAQPELRQHLYRFVRRELDDAEERRRVDEHLRVCAECRTVFDELQWMMGSMRPSSPSEHQELMAELRRVGGVDPPTGGGNPEDARSGGLFGRLKRWLSSGGGSA